jgi:tRNA threonylcarbamoyladenosine biosynthesis protein TsaE
MPLHPQILATRTFDWPDEAACAAHAAVLASHPSLPDALITLHGSLGAGKTTFVRHLLRALGVQGRIKSPTYAVVEPHETRRPDGTLLAISHFDFYRFDDPRELEDAGLREQLAGPGLRLCEWPEKAGPLMPVADLALHIEIDGDDSRRVRAAAGSARGQALLAVGPVAPAPLASVA